jgi:hypothetical protein
MFSFDGPTGFTSNYGWKFTPNAAFSNAMNNTAFIVNVMAGLPYSHFIMLGDMRTDNNAAFGNSEPWSDALLPTYWNRLTSTPTAFNVTLPTTMAWPQILGVWDSPIGNANPGNWNSSDPYLHSIVQPNHMRRDGTRYIMKVTFWIAYFEPGTDRWVRKQVICNNVPDRYIGTRINASGMRVGGGSGPVGEFTVGDETASANAANMSFGPTVPMSPAEVSAMQSIRRPTN